MIQRQTIKEISAETGVPEEDVIDWYDLKEDGTKIICIHSKTEEDGEGAVAGVEYADGTFAVVGCKVDSMVDTKEEMLWLVDAY